MAYRDLREYIEKLEEEKELVRIKEEVDWNLEVGAIIRRSNDLKAPAPFFEPMYTELRLPRLTFHSRNSLQ